MDPRYEPITRWSNIGPFWTTLAGRVYGGFATPWGNLLVKAWRDRLFSERYGYTRTIKVGPLCVSWVRLRRLR